MALRNVAAVDPATPRRDLSDALRRAMTRLGVPLKAVAISWGVNHAYASRVLSNEDPLTDTRIAQLDAPLRRALLDEWAAEEGVLTADRAAVGKAIEAVANFVTDPRLPERAGAPLKVEG